MSVAPSSSRFLKDLNGLTALAVVMGTCVATFLARSMLHHLAFMLVLLVLLCLCGMAGRGLAYALVYACSLSGVYLEGIYGALVFPSPLLLSLIYRMVLPGMALCVLAGMPSGKISGALGRLPIPRRIQFILVVMLRFVPTVVHETREIKDAMRVRGFLRSPAKVLLHLLDTAEYVAVPLVFRSLKVADELSASAIVRGIENPGPRGCYYPVRMRVADWLLVGAVALAVAICCFA